MCGIIGILGDEPIAECLYHSMLQLQHRGQDASGVFLSDPIFGETLRRRSGWVFQLFQEEPPLPETRWGLGHVRYSTSGKGQVEDAQPLVLKNQDHTLAIVHNGNLINYSKIREELENEGTYFQTTCDSESILHILSQNRAFEEPFFDNLCQAVQKVYRKINGSYSVIGLVTGRGIFAFRDPLGIRPLLIGTAKNLTAIASETLALSNIGCKSIRDVEPGEVVFLDGARHLHRRSLTCRKHSHCAFEFNYFAKTPSVMEGKEVYTIRIELGRLLAEKIRTLDLPAIDVVVPVPETGNPAGIALAQHLQLPFAEGFVRHSHVGRTFIIAGQEKRQTASIQKLTPIRSVFEGKTVLLVDDSIIRGTVSQRTIKLAREVGAKKILFASTFPPILHPCVYGIDFPNQDQLIASKKTLPEICEWIGADFVIYNTVEDLKKAIGLPDLCLACVTGKYPTCTKELETLQRLREKDLVH